MKRANGCPAVARLGLALWASVLTAVSTGLPLAADAATGDQVGPTDPMFAQPYVDIDEWRDEPVRHRYVHGGFKGTDARFSFYFPPKEHYHGRFFQHVTPVPISESLAQHSDGVNNQIGFSIASGGYCVETNEGGTAATATPSSRVDPTISGYRVNAAAAQYSRVLAARMYGPRRPYGYVYGGSGGSFKTIAGFENTTGVWDGAVPYVIGSPVAIPNLATALTYALRVLKDKLPSIADAVEAGGSGDMYAGLSDEQRAALLEVTRMGFPPRTWFAYKELGPGAFGQLMAGVLRADPTYVDDFWTLSGYLGSHPPESLLRARIQQKTTVVGAIMPAEAEKLGLPPLIPAGQPRGGVDNAWRTLQDQANAQTPVGFRLANVPGGNLEGVSLIFKTGAAAGQVLQLRGAAGDVVLLANPQRLPDITPGEAVELDNSAYLALQTYHRHQVPSPDFTVWDQFRGPDGKPLCPQRPRLLGPLFAFNGAGALQTGKFSGKMIVVESLMDEASYPWQGDWYRTKVKEALGARLDGNFRLWFTDRAMHTDVNETAYPTQIVSYVGVLQQALRDLAAWVEKGVPPPASTSYQMVDGQVEVPGTAADRKGIQPVVTVTANGAARIDVAVDRPVEFSAVIEVPPNTGKVVAAQWDFEGAGDFPVAAQIKSPAPRVTVKAVHSFSKPGTYFPTLRVASERDGDTNTPYARVLNLARMRVVVATQ
jgi:hypothetical protein